MCTFQKVLRLDRHRFPVAKQCIDAPQCVICWEPLQIDAYILIPFRSSNAFTNHSERGIMCIMCPLKYPHLYLSMDSCDMFAHILQECFTGIGTIMRFLNPHLTSLRHMKSFVSTNPDVLKQQKSAFISAILYAVLCYVGPRYHGARMYTCPLHIIYRNWGGLGK